MSVEEKPRLILKPLSDVPRTPKSYWTDLVHYDAKSKTIDIHPGKSDCCGWTKTNPYWIALDRIDTPMKLMHWVHHISQKTWCTRQVIKALIEAWCKATGNSPYMVV